MGADFSRDSTSPLEITSDAVAIARLKSGDVAVFEHIVRKHGPALIRYAEKLTGSDELAQEIVQDVFFSLWNDRSSIEVSYTLSVYLYWRVKNRSINVVKSLTAQRKREGRWAQEESHTDASRNMGELELEAAELKVAVWEALETLSPRTREVFILIWDQGLDYAEVSRMLGIAAPTVRSQMSRALKRITEIILPRFSTFD